MSYSLGRSERHSGRSQKKKTKWKFKDLRSNRRVDRKSNAKKESTLMQKRRYVRLRIKIFYSRITIFSREMT